MASSGLKLKNVQVYSLGIGKTINRKQLDIIASSKDKVLFVDSFGDLTSVAQTIVQKSCPGRSFSQKFDVLVLHTAETLSCNSFWG